ncbi:MAG TPA: hypothetical protein VD902_08995 [Symbiobacteriaceae bacterium]|nr:hypothetical protein [Symbiobacteriaceae bacterium]
MNGMSIRRMALAATSVALLGALAGCGSAGTAAVTGAAAAGVAHAAAGYTETEKDGDLGITLAIEPLTVGENTFLVNVSDPSVTAVEAQVIMASMGHGEIIDLNLQSPGRFAARHGAISMEGRWLVRVKATLASGDEKDVLFHMAVK